MHNILHEFEFQTDRELAAFECLKLMSPLFSVAFEVSLFKLARYNDLHKILDGFEFLPDPTT